MSPDRLGKQGGEAYNQARQFEGQCQHGKTSLGGVVNQLTCLLFIIQRVEMDKVELSWYDAVACCQWASKRLSTTEAKLEYAARGGLTGKAFPSGAELVDKIDFVGFRCAKPAGSE
jgi:hypothetical protein